jgi:adenine-specific DNA methylase
LQAFKKDMKPTYIYIPTEAEGHTPPYKIHKYFARRPYNVFERLIQSFSAENEIVVDPFCGGGVTIYEGLKQKRKVVGFDLNPLSTFIVRNMVQNIPYDNEFKNIISAIRKYLDNITSKYMFFCKDGKAYTMDWAELAMTVRCPYCGHTTPLSNGLRVKKGKYKCANNLCNSHEQDLEIDASKAERVGSQYLYMVHAFGKEHIAKEPDADDISRYNQHIAFLKEELKKNKIKVPQDLIPLDWDRQFEDGLAKKGILYFQDFFTKRNLYILLLLLNKIKAYEGNISNERYELLRLIFSNIIKDANIMSFTNDGWQSGKPTTWSKHAYWVPNQYCEVTILPIFEKSVERIVNAMDYNIKNNIQPSFANTFDKFQNGCNIFLQNIPINQSCLPEESVDAIITDPPYGSNVQYLELSHFWYPWNKDLYARYPVFELEAVANRKQGFKGAKSQYDYERNLYPVFKSSYQCLKKDKFMTLTFNNKDMSSWMALLFSIFKSGFAFHDMYFQDGVKNYKQTAHTKAEGSPYGDFIYVFKKSDRRTQYIYTSEQDFIRDMDNIFSRHRGDNKDRNETILTLFKEAVPMIEGFVNSYLITHPEHNLYKHFNKNYLAKLYVNEDK